MSKRTQTLKKRTIGFGIASYVLWIGVALTYAICAFLKLAPSGETGEAGESVQLLSDSVQTLLVSIGTTTIIGIIGAILIKDKIRTAIWMACVILSVILWKEVGMYITLAIWLVDEYIIHALYVYNKNKYIINKEIDLRDE